MKAGDRIRIKTIWGDCQDYTVEEFRYCLGIFASNEHRTGGKFTPLCELYENGPYSKNKYISNFGEYYTNQVQRWMDIPKLDKEAK